MGHRHLPHLTLLQFHHGHGGSGSGSTNGSKYKEGSSGSNGNGNGNGNSHSGRHGAIPKGCLAVKVGQEGEEQQRFVVPVSYFNHPLFLRLLKVAEDEYGFDQQGPITLPCHVAEFRNIRGLIDRDSSFAGGAAAGGRQHHGHLVGCFKA